MLRFFRTFLSGVPLFLTPALHAETAVVTGINSARPAIFLFTLAGAIILTLLFRNSATHLVHLVVNQLGALRIRLALKNISPDLLHDFILPGAYGGLAKVDHAVMTSAGIICIQARHYSGIVFGESDEPQWTNVDGGRRRRFLNPIIQNEGRVRAIRKVLPDVPIINLVVFTGAIEFTSAMPENVISVSGMKRYVQKLVFGPAKIDDWDAVWMSLKSAALTDEDTRKDLQAQIGFC